MLHLPIPSKTSTTVSEQLETGSTDTSPSSGQEGTCIVVAVVGTDFLNQPVVRAVERHVDADDLKGFGAHPGDVALGLLLVARLGWVVVTQHHLLVAFGLLVVHPAAERLGVFGVDHTLALQVELHLFHGRHEADGDVAHACGVVAEVHSERAVPVVHDLPHYQQVQFDRLDVWVKVSPTKLPGEFRSSMNLRYRPQLDFYGRVGVGLGVPSKYFPKSLFWKRDEGADGELGVLNQSLCLRLLVLLWRILLVSVELRWCSVVRGEDAMMTLPKDQLQT